MPDINTIAYQLPIEFDRKKLIDEFEATLNPSASKAMGFAITNKSGTDLTSWFNTRSGTMPTTKDLNAGEFVEKNFKKYTLGFPGPWRNDLESYFEDGTSDREMTEWHPTLVNSEMHQLSKRIGEFFNLGTSLRCRASILHGPKELYFHSDPHTPWRVHINLKTGPGTKWLFKDETGMLEWHQPSEGIWLVRTGNIMHNVRVPAGEERWQLYYHIWRANLGSDYHQIA